MIDYKEFMNLPAEEIFKIAQDVGMIEKKKGRKPKKIDESLIENLNLKQLYIKANEREGEIIKEGILELTSEGHGYLRVNPPLATDEDVYVASVLVKKFFLKPGDKILARVREKRPTDKYQGFIEPIAIEDEYYDDFIERFKTNNGSIKRDIFETLTPIFPNKRLFLENSPEEIETRIIDLITPIGKGQRGMIVAPPKAGKTTLLKQIANAIAKNYEDVEIFILLIDERPEEVTDLERDTIRANVWSSTFDKPIENHIRIAELLLERAKRLVELKKDVVILLDSLTRLARAYNLALPASGQTLTGGINPVALYKPKKFFGAARNLEEGGSLTILATALIETGSRQDDIIFEEFKGTGNMELVLDRKIFEKRIFPSIDIKRSSTRKEQLLMDPEELKVVWHIRRVLDPFPPFEAVSQLKEKLKQFKTNLEFLAVMSKKIKKEASDEVVTSN